MRITIVAWGGQGDVRPFVALAKGFKEARHAVCVVAPVRDEPLVRDLGVDYRRIGGDVDEVIQRGDLQAAIERSSGVAALASATRAIPPLIRQWMVDAQAASHDCDVMLGGFLPMFYIGPTLAEKNRVPFIPGYLQPFTPTREFPTFGLFTGPNLGAPLNRLTHVTTAQLLWQIYRRAVNRARRDVLGLGPAPFRGYFGAHCRLRRPILYGFSSHVLPTPADWGDSNALTGYWFLEPPAGWIPPMGLVDFLQAGPAPVYIGFGSMAGRDQQGTAKLVVEALALSGQRGVLLSGERSLHTVDLPDSVFLTGSIPHQWLFPKMAAVVHHGGSGTTGAGCWAGVPSIIIPHNFDQPFWGQRVARLGVGPPPILRSRLTSERLAEAISQSLTDHAMRARAAELGKRIRAEDGVSRAVEIVERVVRLPQVARSTSQAAAPAPANATKER